jgi:hypothetical protein
MSVEKYIVTKESANYTRISNEVIQWLKHNSSLLGFYTYLISLPPNGIFYKSHLRKECCLGVKKLETLLRLLTQYKLITVKQGRNEKGQFEHFDLVIHKEKALLNLGELKCIDS